MVCERGWQLAKIVSVDATAPHAEISAQVTQTRWLKQSIDDDWHVAV